MNVQCVNKEINVSQTTVLYLYTAYEHHTMQIFKKIVDQD